MMNFSNVIADPQYPLVIDTSVVVNLNACSFGTQILQAVPNKIIVAQIAADELKAGTSDQIFLNDVVEAQLIELSDLSTDEFEIYGKIVGKLGDGESATIAVELKRQIFPIIDDIKARDKTAELLPELEPGWSLDLLRHPHVLVQLGSPGDVDAIFMALFGGRMRVPNDKTEEVIQLIGEDRAKECRSLPGYTKRFGKHVA